MNRTERMEEQEIEKVLHEETHGEPRYPVVERTEAAQLGKTVITFVEYDSEGGYIHIETS